MKNEVRKIALCRNSNCYQRHSCYRFITEQASDSQPIFPYAPQPGYDRCDQYWPAYDPSPIFAASVGLMEKYGAKRNDGNRKENRISDAG